jgi:hypothetical protein
VCIGWAFDSGNRAQPSSSGCLGLNAFSIERNVSKAFNSVEPTSDAVFVLLVLGTMLSSHAARLDQQWCGPARANILNAFKNEVNALLGLKSLRAGYIEAVWNLGDLIAWRPAGLALADPIRRSPGVAVARSRSARISWA